jgi:hypothetical protein
MPPNPLARVEDHWRFARLKRLEVRPFSHFKRSLAEGPFCRAVAMEFADFQFSQLTADIKQPTKQPNKSRLLTLLRFTRYSINYG